MTAEIYNLFFIQITLVVGIYVLFFREKKVPSIIKLLVITAYVTIPISIMVKGIASAIYLSDLIGFIIIFYFLMRLGLFRYLLINRYFLSLFILLILLPFSWGLVLELSGEYVLTLRDWIDNVIWFYRNFVYLLVFGIGLSYKINIEEAKEFIEINLGFAALLASFGILSYVGHFNMAVFETIKWGGTIPVWFQKSHIGLGFMGLFRGSVGQWFVVVVLLSIGTFYFVSPKYRKVALITIIAGIGVILLSLSRAGFVGLVVGLTVFGLLSMSNKRQIGLFVVLAFFSIGLFFGVVSTLKERFLPNWGHVEVTGLGTATSLRLFGWQRSIEFFSHNFIHFLTGVGPVEREAVHEIAGIYGPHNEYLDVVFRSGFLGLVVLLWFLLIILLKFFRTRSKVDNFVKPVVGSLIAIIIANSVMALTQSHLLNDYATYTLGFYLYLLYGVFIGARWHGTAYRTKNKDKFEG